MKKNNKYLQIGENFYNTKKSKNKYANRFEVIINDEEIILLSGIENNDSTINVETKTYLTLPSFYRLYDAVNSLKTRLDKK